MEMHSEVWSILWDHTDIISKSLFVVLVVMSCMTWYLIISKSISLWRIKRGSKAFLAKFWNSTSFAEVENSLLEHKASDPFSHLTLHAIHARNHHVQYGATRFEDSGSTGDFVTRSMRNVLDEETSNLENGLTILATIGATAPFVGLFGTVWGVYHALMKIASEEGANFSQLAGPVGEALIMTGLGLAVAIPAVLAYNTVVRTNRVLLGQLDSFAHELFVFLTTGQIVVVSPKAKQVNLAVRGDH